MRLIAAGEITLESPRERAKKSSGRENLPRRKNPHGGPKASPKASPLASPLHSAARSDASYGSYEETPLDSPHQVDNMWAAASAPAMESNPSNVPPRSPRNTPPRSPRTAAAAAKLASGGKLSASFLARVNAAEVRDDFRLNSPRGGTSDRSETVTTPKRPPRRSLADLP